MPRYFFDIYDGRTTLDEEGQELPNLAAARRVATNSLPPIAADEIPIDGDRQHYVVIVKDEEKHPVYAAALTYLGLTLA